MIAARQIFLGRGGGTQLPYDAEVEYLESTGTQWIDTGVQFHGVNPCVKARMCATESADTDQISTIGGNIFRVNFNTGNNTCYYRFYDGTVRTWTFSLSPMNGNWYDFSFSNDCYVNGTLYYSAGADYDFANASMTNLLLFRGRNFSKLRIAYVKIYDGGILLRDFIPVRVGTTGYMYDRVSGQLFRNAGTGAFIIGNNK